MGTPASGPGGGQFWAGPERSAVPAALAALAASYTVAMDRPIATRAIRNGPGGKAMEQAFDALRQASNQLNEKLHAVAFRFAETGELNTGRQP